MELIYTNAMAYNGAEHPLTKTAENIFLTAKGCIEESAAQITEWEEGIKAKQVGVAQ